MWLFIHSVDTPDIKNDIPVGHDGSVARMPYCQSRGTIIYTCNTGQAI